ncbi:MAG: PAS domain-containing protein [bacterium]|nr:MAG: PAS domain-containing protein [bacterium]
MDTALLLFDSLVEGLFLFDREARLLRINPGGERILGRSGRALAGLGPGEVFPGNPEMADLVRACLDENRALVYSGIDFRDPDGKLFALSVSASPVQESDGTLVGAALLMRDETLLKEIDRSFRRADQLATLGVLNLGMAHEIKNPLGGIKGATQLLRADLEEGSPVVEYCDVILREVERIDGLLEGLLAAIPREEVRLEEINIHEVLNEVLTLMELSEETSGLTFTRLYDPSLPTIRGDRNGLTQVFLNLLKNSVEASPEGGRITVRTLVPVGAPVGGGGAQGGAHRSGVLEVIVQDEGPGFGSDVREFAMPFYTTKSKGVGLGLAISEQIVQNHGGTLVLDHGEGGGALVRVYLPLKAGQGE